MQKEKLYSFEGVLRPMVEIERLVPALCRSSIRRHLAAGRDTRQLMLSRDSAALRSASGKRNGAILKKLLDNKAALAGDLTLPLKEASGKLETPYGRASAGKEFDSFTLSD